MTATQAKSDDRSMGRRDLMRRTAIGAGAAIGVGASAGSASADDDDDGSTLKTAAFVAASPPIAAATAVHGYIFDDDHEEDVDDALGWDNYVAEYTRLYEEQLQLEETLASFERDVQRVSNVARERAIFAIYEADAEGMDQSTAESAAEDAIDDEFAIVQEAILTSWNIRFNRAVSVAESLDTHDSTSGSLTSGDGNLVYDATGEESDRIDDQEDPHLASDQVDDLLDGGSTDTYDLADSTSVEYSYIYDKYTETIGSDDEYILGINPLDIPTGFDANTDTVRLAKPDHEDFETADDPLDVDYGNVRLIKPVEWFDLLMDLEEEHSDLLDEIDDMIDSYFDTGEDIDLSTMLGPQHLADTAANAEDFEEAAMAFHNLGYAVADQATIISVEFEGEELELPSRLARTTQDPGSLPVGQEIDPGSTLGSIFAAVNVETEDGLTGETIELTDTFTITDAGGTSEVTFESRTTAESDHDLTNEEITEIFEENQQSNEEATEVVHEVAVGGGGISLPGLDGDVNLGIVAAAVAVGAYLLGR